MRGSHDDARHSPPAVGWRQRPARRTGDRREPLERARGDHAHPGHGAAPGNPRSVAAEEFAKLVGEKTGGEVTVNIAGSEQLGNDVAMLTSLRTGALDLTANSQGAASGLVPELAALGLPFLFEDADAAFKVLEGPVGEELTGKFQDLGIITLAWWDNGIRHITNSKRPIAEPADLEGLKIRTPADR